VKVVEIGRVLRDEGIERFDDVLGDVVGLPGGNDREDIVAAGAGDRLG
jgi:hypothetical protein